MDPHFAIIFMNIFEKLETKFLCQNKIIGQIFFLQPVKARRKISGFISDADCENSVISGRKGVKMFRIYSGIIAIW